MIMCDWRVRPERRVRAQHFLQQPAALQVDLTDVLYVHGHF
jgi:hypothetical protein